MNCMFFKNTVFTVVVLLCGICSAKLTLPVFFSERMVLQRGQDVAIWGWSDPGKSVTVSFGGQKQTVKSDADGKFTVMLKQMKAAKKGQILSVVNEAGDAVNVKDVLVGEVWLCSGQSNMAMTVSRSKDYDKEKVAANYPLIRMFMTASSTSMEPLNDCKGAWKECSPKNVGSFSAAAYLFGRRIHKELDVPVCLIRTAWGGTRIEA